jgi:hypothetical protein
MNKNTEPTGAADDSRAYTTLEHFFYDAWAAADVELKFRFAKPNKTQLRRLGDTVGKNSTQAFRDLLLSAIHPENKDKLLSALEEYPGIAVTFASALMKMVGVSTDLGN